MKASMAAVLPGAISCLMAGYVCLRSFGACVDTAAPGQECRMTGTRSSGGCSAWCDSQRPCSGTKVLTEYNGCNECVSTDDDQATCIHLGCPENCEKRSIVIPCVCIHGACVEGPSLPPGPWMTTPEKRCS